MNTLIRNLTKLADDVRADCDSRIRYRKKYHQDQDLRRHIPSMLLKNIGLQTLAAIRVMHFLRESKIPLGSQIVSRLIRYAFATEVHWRTQIAPGISLVHGTGVVLSHAARIGEGCIIFHNVTLGDGRHPDTLETGAPTLERNVHVGPGATILGPITIGEGSKIMAGAVVTRSIPPYSLVKSPEVQVTARTRGTGGCSNDAD